MEWKKERKKERKGDSYGSFDLYAPGKETREDDGGTRDPVPVMLICAHSICFFWSVSYRFIWETPSSLFPPKREKKRKEKEMGGGGEGGNLEKTKKGERILT